jgi:uncharacterized membrane protein
MSSGQLPHAAKKNLESVTELHRQLLEERSPVEQLGEAIAEFFGSVRFITAHVLAVAIWVALNASVVDRPFDPFPFPLLGLIVGIEFILLTTFVLMNQKLQSRRHEKWAHLNLQICLLTEQEVTKNLQVLNLICKHLGLEQPVKDREVKDLARATSVPVLAKEIDKVSESKS